MSLSAEIIEGVADGSLRFLNLYKYEMNLGDATNLAAALQDPRSRLNYLLMHKSKISSDASYNNNYKETVRIILKALPGSSVVGVGLDNTYDEVIEDLIPVITDPNSNLVSLSLIHNIISTEHLLGLARAVLKCRLASLAIGGFVDTKETAQALADMLQDPNCYLSLLRVGGVNELKNIDTIKKALQNNKNLLYLALGHYTDIGQFLSLHPISEIFQGNMQEFEERRNKIRLVNEQLTPEEQEITWLQCLAIVDRVELDKHMYRNLALHPKGVTEEDIALARHCIQKLQEYDLPLMGDLANYIGGDTAVLVLGYLEQKHYPHINCHNGAESAQAGGSSGETASTSEDCGTQHNNKELQPDSQPMESDICEQKTDYQCQQKAEEGPTPENLLMKILAWIKELTTTLQHKAFAVMTSVLQILESSLQPDKYVIDQLSRASVKEIFEAVYTAYYATEDPLTKPYIRPHSDSYTTLLSPDDVVGPGLTGVMLIGQLSSDIDLHLPDMFGGIAAF